MTDTDCHVHCARASDVVRKLHVRSSPRGAALCLSIDQLSVPTAAELGSQRFSLTNPRVGGRSSVGFLAGVCRNGAAVHDFKFRCILGNAFSSSELDRKHKSGPRIAQQGAVTRSVDLCAVVA